MMCAYLLCLRCRLVQKRLCSGVVGCGHLEYGAVRECPMDTWEIQQLVVPNGNRGNEVVPNMVNVTVTVLFCVISVNNPFVNV